MATVPSLALTAAQLDTLIDALGGPAQALRIATGELTVTAFPSPTAAAPILTVADGIDFESRIARGNFGWRNPDLTETLFPVETGQIGPREAKLFHFNRSLSSADAARLIREDGYTPATIGDILAYGELHPETQRRHPVVGLGSTAEIDGKGSAPALWFDGDRRTLDLIWLDGDWHRNYRFLGVRTPRG